MTRPISRRRFCLTAAAGAAAVAGCRLGNTAPPELGGARITARPGIPPTTSIDPGIHDLVVAGSDKFCWLVVPSGYDPTLAWPLTLFFRGAITPARNYLDNFRPLADDLGLVILAPEATGRTWDLIQNGGFGPDVAFINAALQVAYQTVHIDPARVFTSGFSDGATYSLSLGLTNGDFFTRVAAYSPGYIRAAAERGKPEFFITHGTQDLVLPVAGTRVLVNQLRSADYAVDYREFDGPHAVSLSLTRSSFEWMIRPVAARAP